jgi:hypothetical protein
MDWKRLMVLYDRTQHSHLESLELIAVSVMETSSYVGDNTWKNADSYSSSFITLVVKYPLSLIGRHLWRCIGTQTQEIQ